MSGGDLAVLRATCGAEAVAAELKSFVGIRTLIDNVARQQKMLISMHGKKLLK